MFTKVQVGSVDENGNNPAMSRKWAGCASLSWERILLLAVELPPVEDFSEAAFVKGLSCD